MALQAHLPATARCERCNGATTSVRVSTRFELAAVYVDACTVCAYADPPLYRRVSDEAWDHLLHLSDIRKPYEDEPGVIGDAWVCRNNHLRSEHGEVRVRSDGRSWWMCRPCTATRAATRAASNRRAREASTCKAGHERATHAVLIEDKRGTWWRCNTCQRAARVIREKLKEASL